MSDIQAIIDGLTDAVFVCQPVTSKVLYVNKSCTQVYGYPTQKLLSQGLKLILSDSKEHGTNEESKISNKVQQGESIKVVRELKNAAGGHLWGEVTTNQIEVKAVKYLLITVRDISAQKKATDALEDRELLLDSINHNISEGVYRSYSNGGLIYANDAFAKMFGYKSVDEIMRVKSLDLYAKPKDRKGVTPTVLELGYRSNVETHFKRKDGGTFWGLNSFVLTRDHNGIDIFDGAVRDITVERESQQKIEESQRILESINRNISEGLYRSYSKGGLIYANNAFAKMFGYENAEAILKVKSLELYAKPKDRKGVTPTVLELGYRSNVETHFKRKDGSTFWGLNSFVLTNDHDGNDIFDGAVRDITSERESQKKIEESQRILESINRNISEGLYRSYSKGGLIYANDAFARMFGYKNAEEILKVRSLELYAKAKDRKGVTPTVLEMGYRSNVETHFKRKDGSTFWGLNSFVLTSDHDGNDIFDGAVQDITDERESQRKIEESQRILESINRNISEGLYRSYSKGGLIYANDAFAQMFGYKNAEEILKVKSLELYAKPKDRKGVTPTVLEMGYRSNVETHFKRKDGSMFWGLNSFVLTSDHDGNDIFDGAVRDVSSEKIAAEELNSLNNELVERNFELDQLVYKTSHDLRSPLRSMLGLTNLMKVENTSLEANYFEKIEDRILKMDGFIKSMLDYSRASRLDLKKEKVDFKDLIAECVGNLEYLDGFQEFTIIQNYHKEIAIAYLDRLRLAIVFSNIISNAFKYRKTSAKKSVLKIDVRIENHMLKIVFEDNGIGIAKKYLNKVFDMFYRATEMSEGSGLGMYIVKQALDKLNGTIRIESKLRVGTKIHIEIPEMSLEMKYARRN
jgi:PAS domain S-box-containing protein